MDMQVERKDWTFFADSFSEKNNDRPVTIEQISQNLGDALLAEKATFIALDINQKKGNAAMITVGEGTNTFTHTLDTPDAVWTKRLDSGQTAAMEIVSANGDKLIIRFDDI